ncbi:hypothetical protein HZS_1843 [Henneguya salminicola]|nr:hypothetical protein HZS_1843 [Henneguya salminicola]
MIYVTMPTEMNSSVLTKSSLPVQTLQKAFKALEPQQQPLQYGVCIFMLINLIYNESDYAQIVRNPVKT